MISTNYNTQVGTEDGKLYAKTIFADDLHLENNKNIRETGAHDRSTLGIHDNADIRIAFSVPTFLQWNNWVRDNPEQNELLMKGNEEQRVKAARRLALEKPGWVIISGRY